MKYKAKLEVINYYIDCIKDEIDGAMEYAQKYILYKKENPSWARMYLEMSNAELSHLSYLQTMCNEHVSDLAWVPQEDKDMWNSFISCITDKVGMVKLMLSK